jgi:hypothetical protein
VKTEPITQVIPVTPEFVAGIAATLSRFTRVNAKPPRAH